MSTLTNYRVVKLTVDDANIYRTYVADRVLNMFSTRPSGGFAGGGLPNPGANRRNLLIGGASDGGLTEISCPPRG